jgi:hypothetical protein
MTLFSRGRGGDAETSTPVLDGVEAPRGVVHWRLAGNLGRRYGAVSGDRNPIHLYPVTAKAFGFPTNIAHGMWTKARSLAALRKTVRSDNNGSNNGVLGNNSGTTQGDGHFDASDDGIVFGVRAQKKDVTHLVGRVSH